MHQKLIGVKGEIVAAGLTVRMVTERLGLDYFKVTKMLGGYTAPDPLILHRISTICRSANQGAQS